MFDLGWRSPRRIPVPVISVGNVTTGGTGKTPVVAMIIQMLQQQGRKPGIISRGYGSIDGQSNDEKLVLERLCPGVPHEQHASRYEAARRLTAANPVDVIVMDDGFQHRQLHRDLDVVLIDATNPFGYQHLLPRGLLREPLASLKRADLVLITRTEMVSGEIVSSIEDRVQRIASQVANRIFHVEFRPAALINGAGQRKPLSTLKERSALLVSGIGNPHAFVRTCRGCGLEIADTLWFPDHHHYSTVDERRITEVSKSHDGVPIITTVKDLVKMSRALSAWAIEITAVLPNPEQAGSFLAEINSLTDCSRAQNR